RAAIVTRCSAGRAAAKRFLQAGNSSSQGLARSKRQSPYRAIRLQGRVAPACQVTQLSESRQQETGQVVRLREVSIGSLPEHRERLLRVAGCSEQVRLRKERLGRYQLAEAGQERRRVTHLAPERVIQQAAFTGFARDRNLVRQCLQLHASARQCVRQHRYEFQL